MISAAPFNDQRFCGDTIRRSENPDPRSDIRSGFDGIEQRIAPLVELGRATLADGTLR